MNLEKFPRHELTFGPSPIHPLRRLSAHLGGKVEIHAKREDCNSGLAFGGGETRKLEYLVPEALEDGCDTLVSVGSTQSNHTRQVAAVAAHLGLRCVLVHEKWVNYTDAVYERTGNIPLTRILGAEVRRDPAGFDIGIRPSLQRAVDDVRRAGGKPFAIPPGCSEHPRGGLGYVRFADEVRRQEAELGFRFDYIVVSCVTGGTQAGMVVGFALDGRADRVIGIDASGRPRRTFDQVLRVARFTAEQVELDRAIGPDDIVLDRRFAGPEYGFPGEGTLDAIRLCARLEGMLTDPVSEGKSLHGMIEKIRSGEFPAGSKVLYVHLGGAPVLGAYGFLFRNG